LRWRARRGTRELDALVGWWLDVRHDGAGMEAREAFAALLDAQDPDLWGWLMGHARAPHTEWQAIIDEIRAAHRI
jgi:antitoxin CptB